MQADVRLAHPRLRSCADARDGESICHAAKPRREYNSPGGRIGKHTFRLLVRNGTALRYLRGMREMSAAPDGEHLRIGDAKILQEIVMRAETADRIDGVRIAGHQKGLATAAAKVSLLPRTGETGRRHPIISAKALKGGR